MNEKKTIYGNLGLTTSAIIWGAGYVIGKSLTGSLLPFQIQWYKYAIAAVAMLIMFYKRIVRLNQRAVFRGILLGIILYTATTLQTLGSYKTTAGKVAFITTMYVIWVPFLMWFLTRKRPGIRTAAGSIMALVGLMLLSLNGEMGINPGDCLVLIASMVHAVHITYTAKTVSEADPIGVAAVQFLTAGICGTICAVATRTPFALPVVNGQIIWQLIYSGLLATLAGFLIQAVSQRYANPSTAPVILSTQSVFGMAFSVWFGMEQLTVRVVIGCVLMFGSVLVLECKGSKGKEKRAVKKRIRSY